MKKLFTVLALAFAASTAHANLADCTPYAGKAVASYLNNKTYNLPHSPKWGHQLYKSFAGKNYYNQIVYTYLYKVSDGKKSMIARVTMNHACQMTTAGSYADEQAMDDDDRDAAQSGGEF